MKRDHLYFILAVVGAFFLLLAGAWTSPTFSEQQNYIEAAVMFGALLFVFSAVVVIAAMGFHSFSLFMALFLAMAISLYGIEAGYLVLGMTYVIWGLVFAIELLLYHNRVESAVTWFRKRYTFRTFSLEFKAFYPMLWIFYFLLEYLPHLVSGETIARFDPKKVYEQMRTDLRP